MKVICVCVCDQNSEEPHLAADHIKQIIGILRDFIHSEEHGVMASMISELKEDLKFDSFLLSQIPLILFGFQSVVSTLCGPREHARKQEAH